MKESISYTFLLNIIIIFVFICFAVIMGIFSYYRAFKANTVVLNSIEKYEGFNCLSQEESARGLTNLGYKTPFKANKKSVAGSYGKVELLTNSSDYDNLGYSVVYYRLDNSREYQYGVYTYMYIDLPVVNRILRIPVFGKTKILYEFRILEDGTDMRLYLDPTDKSNTGQGKAVLDLSIHEGISGDIFKARTLFKADANFDGDINAADFTRFLAGNGMDGMFKDCGAFVDFSIYGN